MHRNSPIINNDDFYRKVFTNKNILHITTSDIDYIRNKQNIDNIKKYAKKIKIISPKSNSGIHPITLIKAIAILVRSLIIPKKKYDIIFLGGLPQIILPFIFTSNRIVVTDFFISIYDTIIQDRKALNNHGILPRLLIFLDKTTLKKTTYVICDTNEHKDYFADFFCIDKNKMVVQYLEADTSIYYPRKIEKPHEYKDKFVVLFFGAMNPLQGVEIILKAARLLHNNSNIVFLFVGPFRKIKNFEYYAKYENIVFLCEWTTQKNISTYIAYSDLCLAGHFENSIDKAKRVIAGKTYTYLSMNKQVILGDNKANRELFSEKQKYINFVEMGNPKALAKVIDNLYQIYGSNNE